MKTHYYQNGSARQDVCLYFQDRQLPEPLLVIDPLLLDSKLRAEAGQTIPVQLKEKVWNKQYVSGCYAFIDFGFSHAQTVLYAGTARRLWNRLQTHWCHGNNFLADWFDCLFNQRSDDAPIGSGAVEVCVWLADDSFRWQLEADLIEKVAPVYNQALRRQQRENAAIDSL